MPRFLVDMDEDTIPLEAGIEDRAISFTKGCYVGQEVIVRVTHRGGGRVAKRLVRWKAGAFAPEVPVGDARILRAIATSAASRARRFRPIRTPLSASATSTVISSMRGTEVTVVWNDAQREGVHPDDAASQVPRMALLAAAVTSAVAVASGSQAAASPSFRLRQATAASPRPRLKPSWFKGNLTHPHVEQRRRLDAGRRRARGTASAVISSWCSPITTT